MTRGKLKIFFGAFPGAGKTNAMLAAARRVHEAGRDVVVGVVETHEEPDTRALLAGIEMLAPPVIGGAPRPGELNLDAALARKPEVIVIDDLAHANPEGSRHPKRWNDADELLDNGIDVYTTLGVQHLESLNDVVGEISGIHERETVPDTFFDSAEETVMVDMSADELLARIGEGRVHVGDDEKSVATTFYSKGSLLALREIALRRTADVVEDEVRKVRAARSVDQVWKTQGHLLCCIGAGEGSEHVVRSAARLANRLDVEWTAAYVETPRLQRLRADERARILGVVSLAEELGARTAILTGNDVAEAVVDYARDQNISTVLVGRERARPLRLTKSTSDRIASASPDIDVIEIGRAGAEAGTTVVAPPMRPDVPSPRAGEKRVRYIWTALVSLGATVAAGLLHTHFDLATLVLVYTLALVMVAVRWGRGPSIFAAVLNVFALDFFFVPPRLSFAMADVQYLLTFLVMLAVGVFIGQLAGSLRFQARVASHREKRARTLYEFTRDLARLQTTTEVIETTESFMSRHFRARVAVLVPDATGSLVSPTARGMTNPFDSTAAQWAFDRAQRAGAGTDTLAGNEYLFLPLKAPTSNRGVLAVRPERTRDLFIPEQRHQFEIFAALVATALERVHYVDVARDAMLMARIESGDLRLNRERYRLADIVQSAVERMGAATAKHEIRVEVPPELPAVEVDRDLLERVFRSMVGNVVKHTPAGTHVTIAGRVRGERIEVSIEDDGPGLPNGREDEVFQSFARGEPAGARRGAGLGLAICRAIVEAHGGSVHAEGGRPRGARFVFTLPLRAQG